jgi:hypothetical protein
MKAEISYNLLEDNYSWELYDGPDGIDYHSGTCKTLGECFEGILVSRVVTALHYTTFLAE